MLFAPGNVRASRLPILATLIATVISVCLLSGSKASAHFVDVDSGDTTTSSGERVGYASGIELDDGEVTAVQYDGRTTLVNLLYVEGTSGDDQIDVYVDNGDSTTMDISVSVNGEAPVYNFAHGLRAGLPHTHTNQTGSHPCKQDDLFTTCTVEETRYSYYDYEAKLQIFGKGGNDDINIIGAGQDSVTDLKEVYVYSDDGDDEIDVDLPTTSSTAIVNPHLNGGNNHDTVHIDGEAAKWSIDLADGYRDSFSHDSIIGIEDFKLDAADATTLLADGSAPTPSLSRGLITK